MEPAGEPRAGAVAEHPGVILCFNTSKGSRRRSFDRFTHWSQNLRALALNLEHLRLANLYGVEADEEQYAGWRALPAAPDAKSDYDGLNPLTWACTVIARYAGDVIPSHLLRNVETFQLAYRKAVARWHPDRGGNRHRVATRVGAHRRDRGGIARDGPDLIRLHPTTCS